jgi:Domain of unknown function (DUF4279)
MNTPHNNLTTFSAGAALRVSGFGLDMEDITQQLGHVSSHTHQKGELNQLKEPYGTDMWLLDSPIGKDQPLESHLNWLAGVLLPHKQYISQLRKEQKIDIYCYKTCYTEQASLNLSSQALRIFTELNFDLGVSLIFLPDDGPDETTGSIK